MDSTQKEVDNKKYRSNEWLSLALASSYQLFILPDDSSHLKAIALIFEAYQYTKQAEKINRVLRQISQDAPVNHANSNARQDAKQLLQYIKACESNQPDKLLTVTNYFLSKIAHKQILSQDILEDIYLRRGIAAYSLKKYTQSITELEHILSLGSNHFGAFYLRGKAYQNLGEYQKAIIDFDQAIQHGFDTATVYHDRGIASLSLRHFPAAIKDLQKTIDRDPDYDCIYLHRSKIFIQLQNYHRTIEELDLYLDKHGKSVNGLNNRGLAFYHEKKYEDALKDLEAAFSINPKASKIYYNRALVYIDLKKFDLALADCKQGMLLDPQNTAFLALLGTIYLEMHNPEEAVVEFNRAIKLNSRDAELYISRAEFYLKMRRYNEALRDCDHAIGLDRSIKHIAEKLKGLIFMSWGRYLDAIHSFNKALVDTPLCQECLELMGKTFHIMSSKTEQVTINRDNLNPEGTTLEDQNVSVDYEEVIKFYDHLIELNSTDTKSLANRGEVFWIRGETKKGLVDYKRAIELDKSIVDLLTNRGTLLSYLGFIKRQ